MQTINNLLALCDTGAFGAIALTVILAFIVRYVSGRSFRQIWRDLKPKQESRNRLQFGEAGDW